MLPHAIGLTLENLEDDKMYRVLTVCHGCRATLTASREACGRAIRAQRLHVAVIAAMQTPACVNQCRCGFALHYSPMLTISEQHAYGR